MFMEPLALGTRSPHPHGLARCILGRAGMKRLCLAGDVGLLPKVACLPFLLGHILRGGCNRTLTHVNRSPRGGLHWLFPTHSGSL